ncbi:hypothetical protein KY325_02805 [Candidatus Woesearchaeota archaeon]|nr:hypothetical protein [Candidatus Woesearchaeota archaeon]
MRRLAIYAIFLISIIIISSALVYAQDEKEEAGLSNTGYFVWGEYDPARVATLFVLGLFQYKKTAPEDGLKTLVLVGRILPKVLLEPTPLIFRAVIVGEENIVPPEEKPPGPGVPPPEPGPVPPPKPKPGPGVPPGPEPEPLPEPEPIPEEVPRVTIGKDSASPTTIPLYGELFCEDGSPVSGATYTFTIECDEIGLIFSSTSITAITNSEGIAQTSVTSYFNPPGPYEETEFTVSAEVTSIPSNPCPGSTLQYTTATTSLIIAVDP